MRKSWSLLRTVLWLLLIVFVILYPMLISIYVFMPLFIGFAGLLILRSIEGKGYMYFIVPLVYLINLEINLSLPMMLTLFAILLYYLTLYNRVQYLKKCKFCVSALSVVFIDIYYLLTLTGYDLLVDTQSIVVDKLLWYSIMADVILAVF